MSFKHLIKSLELESIFSFQLDNLSSELQKVKDSVDISALTTEVKIALTLLS
jgi:hypothetical protein